MKKFLLFLLVISNVSIAQTIQDAHRLNDNEQFDAATEIFKKLIIK